MRISKSELEGALKILRRAHPAADYSLDYSNGGVMLRAGIGGMSEVSRRGTKSEVYQYVWVAIKALQIDRDIREQAEEQAHDIDPCEQYQIEQAHENGEVYIDRYGDSV